MSMPKKEHFKVIDMKNHYIPQFIIKNFSKTINVFDLDSGTIREDRPSSKVFFKKNFYTEEVEKLLNANVEQPFHDLLETKLTSEKKEIILTRQELFLIKKFLLISSFRINGDSDALKYFMRSFKHNTDQFFRTSMVYRDAKMKYLGETGWDTKTFFNNTLKAYLRCDMPEQMIQDELLCKETFAYAYPFLASYIAIWDVPEGSEFILSDTGMISEYEGFHLVTGGLDMSKLSYLMHKMKVSQKNAQYYANLINTLSVMYENYNFFSISKTRMLVMINPFFRQYFKFNVPMLDISSGEVKNFVLDEPDIWPAIIQNKKLFEIPSNKYMIKNTFSMSDQFKYQSKTLSDKEVIYINTLIILESEKLIGFGNPKNVFPSIESAVNFKCHLASVPNEEIKYKLSDADVFCNYLIHSINEPLTKLCTWCEQKMEKPEYRNDIDEMFEAIINDLYRDMRNNPYIYEFLLENKEQTYANSHLDFFGKGNKDDKLEYIQQEYDRIIKERNGNGN